MPRYFAMTEDIDKSVAPIHERFEDASRSQRVIARRLTLASPALLLQSALCELAGTGPGRYAQFRDSVADYQRAWREFFLPRVFAKRRLTAADIAALPRFQDSEAAFDVVMSDVRLGLWSLMAYACLPMTLAWLFVRRGVRAVDVEAQTTTPAHDVT